MREERRPAQRDGQGRRLAVELGEAQRITFCGFVREGRVNVYTEPNRID